MCEEYRVHRATMVEEAARRKRELPTWAFVTAWDPIQSGGVARSVTM
jgi:hypothetical protein